MAAKYGKLEVASLLLQKRAAPDAAGKVRESDAQLIFVRQFHSWPTYKKDFRCKSSGWQGGEGQANNILKSTARCVRKENKQMEAFGKNRFNCILDKKNFFCWDLAKKINKTFRYYKHLSFCKPFCRPFLSNLSFKSVNRAFLRLYFPSYSCTQRRWWGWWG